MNDAAIEINHLFFSYPQTPVLNNVSLTIMPGEFIGLIGPNGGGKTTLLKLMMGFLKPNKGQIKIFGHYPQYHSAAELNVAYVPQTLRFDRDFPISVFDVVLSGLLSRLPWYGRYSDDDKKKAFQALQNVDLAHLAEHPFGALSGGQAQRTLIARALVSEPKILLLDEPTASVDTKAEADIYSLLKNLKGKIIIVMVTHDLSAAIEHVQRIYCVQGNVFALKPEEVCEHFVIGLYHKPLIKNPLPIL